ncbi:MAG: threonine/serine exporter family protein [Clostridia bacterium]|nr:threonine/serine exporter family protein [Clostridia bacterium]
MTEKEARQLVTRVLDVGERMLLCGAEVSRVEDSISRMLRSFGAERVEVFTILSYMSLTAMFPDFTEVTEIRRVSIVAYSNDFARLEQLNALSRNLCQHPSLSLLEEGLGQLPLGPGQKRRRELCLLLGYVLSGFGFALFFGGSYLDALGAGLCCLVVWFLNWLLKKSALQRLFHAFLISFIAGILSYLVILMGLGEHPGQIMMGVIMVLIPGIAMTNSMREVLISDTISGILRLIESLLTATAVAFGFALAMVAFGGLFPEEPFTSLAADALWMQLFSVAVGTLGFFLLFHSRPNRLIPGVLGGMLTWIIYRGLSPVLSSSFLCVAAAAAFGAAYAEIMARVCKAPATVFTILAEISLIPGASLYLTMYHLVAGRHTEALSFGGSTLLTALSIALGIVFVTAFTTSFYSRRKRPATHHKHSPRH